MLEEVCHGGHLVEQPGQERGAVHTELRGEVFGCERSCAEAFERHARAGRDVRVANGTERGGGGGAETRCRNSVYFYEWSVIGAGSEENQG